MLWLCYHPDFFRCFFLSFGGCYTAEMASTPRSRKCYRSAPWPDVFHHIRYGCLEFIGVFNMRGLGIIIPWFFHSLHHDFSVSFCLFLLKGKWLCL